MAVATSTDQCPWCDSLITRAKFVEVQGRIRVEEKRQLATLEADLRSKFEVQLKEVNEKLQNLAAEKAAFELRLKQAVELATLTARKAADEEAAKKAAEDLARARELLKIEHDREKLKLAADAANEKEELAKKVGDLQRQLEARSGQEEVPDVNVFQDLKAAFAANGDKIVAIPDGTGVANILVEIRSKTGPCGKILIDARQRKNWQSNYASKLHDEMIEDSAEYAILATTFFPKDERDLCEHKGVVVAHPARVVTLVGILRRALVAISQAKLSAEQRADKMTEVYEHVTSKAFNQKLAETGAIAKSMLKLDGAEADAHRLVWKKRSDLAKKLEHLSGELAGGITSIVEGNADD